MHIGNNNIEHVVIVTIMVGKGGKGLRKGWGVKGLGNIITNTS